MNRLRALLYQQAQTRPNEPAITGSGASRSYQQLFERARLIAEDLRIQGLPGRGAIAAIAGTTSLSFVEAWWGVMLLDMAVFLINPLDPPERQEARCVAAGASWILRPSADKSVSGYEAFALASPDPSPSNAAVLLSTSGSSSAPQTIPITPTQLIESAWRVNQRLGVTEDSRWLLSLLPCHIGGLSIVVRSAVAGCSLIIPRDLKRPTLYRATVDHGVSHLSLVPSVAGEFLRCGPIPETVQGILLGGERLPYPLRQALATIPSLFVSYGSTETTSCVAAARLTDVAHLPDAVGTPIADTTITIVDPEGRELPPGTEGIVEVTGPTVATSPERGPGVWRSSDRGYLDNDGILHIAGRVDDIINSGGMKISASEIAETTTRSGLAQEAWVIKVPDAQWGEQGVLFVTGITVSADELYQSLRARLGPFRAPRRIIILREIPRTAIGKVDQGMLRLLLDDASESSSVEDQWVVERWRQLSSR